MRLALWLAAAALPLAAQPKLLVNAQVDTRSAATGLEREFKTLASAQPQPAWIGYTAPVLEGHSLGCELVSPNGWWAPGVVHLEPPDHMVVLLRVESGAVERVRAISPDCEIDGGGAPVHWLTDVRPAESVAMLSAMAARPGRAADGALTAYENLLLSARLYLIPRRERDARIHKALETMGLTDASQRLVQTFSGGMIRRLEIAQSMLHDPAVLFMDEPTVGLDPVARHSVWDHVRDLRDRFGTTMLMTTHLMDEADALCDRIGVLHAGKLEEVGTPVELKALVGPQATLDDVFAAITGAEIAGEGSYRNVREGRSAESAHG